MKSFLYWRSALTSERPGRRREESLRLSGQGVRLLGEVDKLNIPYFEKPGSSWSPGEGRDFADAICSPPLNERIVACLMRGRPAAGFVRVEDAVDVLHDCWKHLGTRIKSYDPDRGRPMAYLLRILRRRLDAIERKRRTEAVRAARSLAERSAQKSENIREHLGSDWAQRMHEHIQSLNPSYRSILQLYYFEEKGTPEIANLLGIETNNARQRLRRARNALRKRISESLIETRKGNDDWPDFVLQALRRA